MELKKEDLSSKQEKRDGHKTRVEINDWNRETMEKINDAKRQTVGKFNKPVPRWEEDRRNEETKSKVKGRLLSQFP